MTYGIYAPCAACAKSGACTDQEKIQRAIYDIHTQSGDGHKGGGTIAIQCSMIQRVEPAE